MVKEYNVLISSVGGQGGVTLSRILSNAALLQGLNIRVGETLGMAQRGGSVQSHIRVGDHVHGSLIRRGGADVLLALEPGEAARVSAYLGPRTRVIMNAEPSVPIPVMLGQAMYPKVEEIRSSLEDIGCRVYSFNAQRQAQDAGAPRSVNVVVLGAYMALGDDVFTSEAVESALRSTLPGRYLEENLRAFEAGRRALRGLT